MEILSTFVAGLREDSVLLHVSVMDSAEANIFAVDVAVSEVDYLARVSVEKLGWTGDATAGVDVIQFLETNLEAVKLLVDTATTLTVGEGFGRSR